MTDRRLDITHVFAPGRAGGLERVVEMLASGHAARGHHVRALGIVTGETEESPVMQRLAAAGVDVTTVRVPPRAYRGEQQSVMDALEALPRGVVHTHGYRADVLHSGGATRRGWATVTTLHGFTGGDLKNRFFEYAQRRACRRIGRVVGVSRPIVDRMRASGVAESRLLLIPNAYTIAETPLLRLDARERLGLPVDGLALGWVGRLTREKGADVLIDALSHLADVPCLVAFVGDGVETRRLREQAALLGVEKRTLWLGSIDGISALFGAFDALVLSSRTEGTPIVLFEAMAARVPIVATAVGGVPDVLSTSSAVLVPPESPEGLASGIRSLFADPQATRRRVERASTVLRERFAAEGWLDSYEAVYLEALWEKRS